MVLQWLFALLHLLALGVGLGAVWARAAALAELERGGSLRRVFDTDTWWLAALTVWFVTGLTRVIAGLEMPGMWYVHNPLFWTKMGVFVLIFVLELWPMTTILQWGFWVTRKRPFEYGPVRRLVWISRIEAGLVIVAAALAVLIARGHGVA